MSYSYLIFVLGTLVAWIHGFQVDQSIAANELLGNQLRARFDAAVSNIEAAPSSIAATSGIGTTSRTSGARLAGPTALRELSSKTRLSAVRAVSSSNHCIPQLIGSPQAPPTPAPTTRQSIARGPYTRGTGSYRSPDFDDDCDFRGGRDGERFPRRIDERSMSLCRKKRTLPNDDVRRCCKVTMPHEVRTSTRSTTRSCTTYRNERYYTRCGLFGWSRCSRYRTIVNPTGTCYRAQTLYQLEEQCCPTEHVACCVGTVYIRPRTIHITTSLTINLVKSCVTVDEFTAIVIELEQLGFGK